MIRTVDWTGISHHYFTASGYAASKGSLAPRLFSWEGSGHKATSKGSFDFILCTA